MAESDGGPYENAAKTRPTASSDDSDADEPIKLDIGVDLSRNFERSSTLNDFGPSGSNIQDVPRKEDNPFSFKHFLRSGTNSYHSQGARPKVYCDGRPVSSISDLDLHNTNDAKQNRVVPEYSSALPDFVQDHMVVEQCYLNKDGLNRKYGDLNNLPDFTLSRLNRLDLNSSRNERRTNPKSNAPIPLDLPVRPQAEFPLDLPVNESSQIVGGTRSCPPSVEVAVSKSLPDFLADGAVRTKNEGTVLTGQASPERERDVDRLRQDLELCRRQLLEQTRRAELLQRELDAARNKEHEYTQNLGKALGHVEENLEKSNKRALAAENTIVKLRQEVKTLTAEINCLKCENQELRGEQGAAGGPTFRWPSQRQTQRLASDLRSAANTAEHSLRQLLIGVDNLRIMASSLENMHRIEENNESDFDFDDSAGPAL